MNENFSINPQQKQTIKSIIYRQEIERAKEKRKDIYDKYIDDQEFWDGLAKQITDDLIGKGYSDGFQLKNERYSIILIDEDDGSKYTIDTVGGTNTTSYKKVGFFEDLEWYQWFFIIMSFVYLIAFLLGVFGSFPSSIAYWSVGLGIVNQFLLWNS